MLDRTIPPYDVQMDQAQTELLRFLAQKSDLIHQRNKLVGKPFFLFRRRLKKMVKELDAKLNSLDKEIAHTAGIVLKGKKIVQASSLTLRFYRRDGWTLRCLEGYVDGEIHDSLVIFDDEEDESYFTIGMNAKVSSELLYDFEVARVVRPWKDYPEDDDKTYFCRILGRL